MSEVTAKRVLLKNKEGEYLLPKVAVANAPEEGNEDPITSGAVKAAIDAAIKSVPGGTAIGTVFAYPGAVPPEGAYLLNGQTITGCNELYPKFWEWLNENAADEFTQIPVYKKWKMPFLNSDGEVGGDEYAVHMPLTGSMSAIGDAEAYKSFDFSQGYWGTFSAVWGANGRAEVIYYSPQKLKLSQVDFQTAFGDWSDYLMVNKYTLQASNDNASWVDLGEVSITDFNVSSVFKINIPDSKYSASVPGYKYFKFICENNAVDMQFHEITLHGEEYLYTANIGRKYILTMDNDTFDNIKNHTGICGGFVIDRATGNVRLPDYRGGTIWGGDTADIGKSLIAGIPDIDLALRIDGGGVTSFVYKKKLLDYGSDDLAGVVSYSSRDSDEYVYTMSSGDRNRVGDLLKAEEYGRSNTVQPPAICVSFCIQVFNAATALSEQESAYLASQMQMRMQTDLSNGTKATLTAIDNIMPDSIDYVIEHKEGADGSWWYDRYRSGKVVQGGVCSYLAENINRTNTITLPVEMRDTNYVITYGEMLDNGQNWDYGVGEKVFYQTISTTGFDIYQWGYRQVRWRVEGYAATE